MDITVKSSIGEVLHGAIFEQVKKYVFYSGDGAMIDQIKQITPEMVQSFSPTWNAESMVKGLKALTEVAKRNWKYVYNVYSDSEREETGEKDDVVVINFPIKKKTPFIVVCAGGGYTSVCSGIEGFPVAKDFNDLGYNVFVLNYRVGGKEVMPKPIDDLAAAIKYIQRNAEYFNVERDKYVVCGFSAGGNLTCEWGSANHGYSRYGIVKPTALFPVYPVCDSTLVADRGVKEYPETLFGTDSAEAVKEYNVLKHLEGFPPSYIVACKDDTTVMPENSIRLSETLTSCGIKNVLELGEKGGHGFGDGKGTSVEGWTTRAIEFLKSV